MTEYGKFKKGAWIPEKIILHAWRYHCEFDSEHNTPQEAWNRADSLEEWGDASVESIQIGDRILTLGCYSDDWGEESKRILKEEYGVCIHEW